jgi:hypothetical protein
MAAGQAIAARPLTFSMVAKTLICSARSARARRHADAAVPDHCRTTDRQLRKATSAVCRQVCRQASQAEPRRRQRTRCGAVKPSFGRGRLRERHEVNGRGGTLAPISAAGRSARGAPSGRSSIRTTRCQRRLHRWAWCRRGGRGGGAARWGHRRRGETAAEPRIRRNEDTFPADDDAGTCSCSTTEARRCRSISIADARHHAARLLPSRSRVLSPTRNQEGQRFGRRCADRRGVTMTVFGKRKRNRKTG